MEIWKDIQGYEGVYQISNLGRVKSLNNNRTKKEKILKPGLNSRGYCQVDLCKNGKKYKKYVHRLVADAFIPNPNNLPIINHIDENSNNNVTSNLEWCDSKYNMQYSLAKKVNQYDSKGSFIRTWDCIRDVERELGINQSNICECCKGKRNTAGGYIWRYADDR